MIGTLAVLAGLAATPGASPPRPASSTAEFRTWFEAARRGDLVIPDATARAARRFRYVFVGGFGNERMAGYFKENGRELLTRGVPPGAIHHVYPSSHKTIEENADEVRERFLEVSREGSERLVVIAHSRGACDVLAFALREPEFVADRVEALFLVQGPFGGSALADYVRGEGPSMDRNMRPVHRVVVGSLAASERLAIRRGNHGGLADLTRAESRRYWSRLLDERADAVPVVGPKAYFVQSESPSSRLGPFRRAPGWYLTTYDGPNDGVVAVDDQRLPGLGTCLRVPDCGHADLTLRKRAGKMGKRLRVALVQCVIMAVGRDTRPDKPTDGSPRPKTSE
jgi:pimeloyl-ACP methyl ester carboxylesterase